MKKKKLMKSLLFLGLLLSVMLINSCMGMLGCVNGGIQVTFMKIWRWRYFNIKKALLLSMKLNQQNGKYFRPMHWDVFLTIQKYCPLCGMALKDVTLQMQR